MDRECVGVDGDGTAIKTRSGPLPPKSPKNAVRIKRKLPAEASYVPVIDLGIHAIMARQRRHLAVSGDRIGMPSLLAKDHTERRTNGLDITKVVTHGISLARLVEAASRASAPQQCVHLESLWKPMAWRQ